MTNERKRERSLIIDLRVPVNIIILFMRLCKLGSTETPPPPKKKRDKSLTTHNPFSLARGLVMGIAHRTT